MALKSSDAKRLESIEVSDSHSDSHTCSCVEGDTMTHRRFLKSAVFPSNFTWRLKEYFKLIDKHRVVILEKEMPAVWPVKELKVETSWDASSSSGSTAISPGSGSGSGSGMSQPPAAKRPRVISSTSVKDSPSLTSVISAETSWTVADIAKAGCLLQEPPLEAGFEDEEEMRRVYALIFDVFRYKAVLNQTLRDATFYHENPQFSRQQSVVELLLYDLHKRRFLPRSHQADSNKGELFRQANLADIDNTLLALKTRIAASLARIRIGSQALQLNTLLPSHLRDDRVVSLDEAFVTGWVNSFLISEEVRQVMEKVDARLMRPNQEAMEPFNYQPDPICPKFVLCHPTRRVDLLQSPLVRDNLIVLQDRSFCVGPALLFRVLQEYGLTGKVVQTHITTPRSVAYFANIITEDDKIEELLAFGAGEKKEEYESYLQHMGVTNTRIYSDRFVDVRSDSDLLEGVVGVLATPPNTYSAVTDPVDLACSRGGDIEMLRVLTDVAGNTGSSEKVGEILEEQRQTLMHSMSKPQIQVVIYETHSALEDENEAMVNQSIEEMNRTARERHAEEQGQRMSQTQVQASEQQVPSQTAQPVVAAQRPPVECQHQEGDARLSTASYTGIKVPPCDLYEVGKVPNVCLNPEKEMQDEGCYLALLQRKEIVRLDAKYMINIAESRGLFGDQGVAPASKKSRAQKKRAAMAAERASSRSANKRASRGYRKVEVERIAAPTQASLLRQADRRPEVEVVCKRHLHHTTECDGGGGVSKVAETRRRVVRGWWGEAARHIAKYRTKLEAVFTADEEPPPHAVTPVVPPLKLTRPPANSRVPFPLHVTCIHFQNLRNTQSSVFGV